MSEQAPETPAGRGRTPSSRENVFSRRIGPLPMWQWLLIALAMVAVYVIFEYRKKNKSSNQAGGAQAGGTTGEAQVPQFVNQTYTTVVPPSPPNMPPGSSVPPPRPHTLPSQPVNVPPPRPVQPAGGPTFGGNTLVNQAVSQLQSQGYNVTGVMREGIAGFRQASTLPQSQYGQAYVAGVTYSGKDATVYAG